MSISGPSSTISGLSRIRANLRFSAKIRGPFKIYCLVDVWYIQRITAGKDKAGAEDLKINKLILYINNKCNNV